MNLIFHGRTELFLFLYQNLESSPCCPSKVTLFRVCSGRTSLISLSEYLWMRVGLLG